MITRTLATIFALLTSCFGAVYEYDQLGRLIQVEYPNGAQIIFTYDANGNRASYTSSAPGATTLKSVALASGSPQNISISNTGGLGTTYDWYRDGAKISTTSAPSLAVSGFSSKHAGNYRVIVGETDGAVSIVELMVKLSECSSSVC